MYEATVVEEEEVVTLDAQLERDASATVRDFYLDRLRLAQDEIEVALVAGPSEADRVALLKLSEAIATGESVLLDVWDSYHGVGNGAARFR